MNPYGITERPCKLSDEDFFCSLVEETLKDVISAHRPFRHDVLREKFLRSYPDVEILMKDDEPIGFYQLRQMDKELKVVRFFLRPQYQRQGIGKWYFTQFEEMGCDKIILNVWDNNPAVEFYRHLGYKETGDDGKGKLRMEKKT